MCSEALASLGTFLRKLLKEVSLVIRGVCVVKFFSRKLLKEAFKRRQGLHLHFKRRQCLYSFILSKGNNSFIYISKDDNVFSHLCFQKATMLSFTFRRRKCLQSFMLSKGDNAFIYFSKKTISSVIYAFKRRQ